MQNTINHNQWVIKHSLNAFLLSAEIDGRFRLDHPFGCRNTEVHVPLLIILSFKSRYPSASESTKKAGNLSMHNCQTPKNYFLLKIRYSITFQKYQQYCKS